MFRPEGDKAAKELLPGRSASSSVALSWLSSLPRLKERRNVWPLASSSSSRRDRLEQEDEAGQKTSSFSLLLSRQSSAL